MRSSSYVLEPSPLNPLETHRHRRPRERTEGDIYHLSANGVSSFTTGNIKMEASMHNEFTAIIENEGEWFIAYCPEVPGANGQGRTKVECLENLRDAIELVLEDRRADALRGIPADAERGVVTVG
jgi:predicted RNase H-like HicB family nuclease